MLNKLFGGLFVALFLVPAYAQTPQTFGEKIWWASSQNRLAAEVSRAVGVPHPGIPYLNPPPGSVPVRNGAIVPQAGDWPSARMQGNLPGNGPVIDVNAKFKPSSIGAATGRLIRRVGPIGTAVALVDFIGEVGFTLSHDPAGNPVLTKPGASTDLWSVTMNTSGTKGTIRASSVSDACTKNGHQWKPNPFQPGNFTCFITSQYVYTPTKVAATTQPGVPEPATIEELENAIAAKSGWPSGSSVSPAIVELIKAGEQVETETPTVSGPASQILNQSTTNNTANNTTTNTTTTNNYTYQGNQVTVNQTTITTITNNTTGETTTETTTTEEQQENKPPETPFEMPCGIAGKPPCGVKVDETGVNSDSSTVFDAAKSNIDEVQQAAKDALADGGPARSIQAPQWSWTFLLPSGCSPYPLEPFGMSVDVCAFQDTIHDLMSLLWVGAGLFGLLGLLRSAFGE